jgi:SpoVK/Ycf46/Vps4 family AAA+-type ATPase
MSQMDNIQDYFEDALEFPNANADRLLAELVGLDELTDRLVKEATLLLDSGSLATWMRKFHKNSTIKLQTFVGSLPFFIFCGDVGTGKTALAENIGSRVCRELNINVTVYRLSLRSRGSGVVGQMTQLLSNAFKFIASECKRRTEHPDRAGILLIDEGDALAQSRQESQMHHEDRAGVNALIRGLNDLAESNAAAMVILCTNRPDSIDPAIQRRAADIITFSRPSEEQRRAVLKPVFDSFNLSEKTLEAVVKLSGPTNDKDYGYTYSDLKQRFVRNLILQAYPNDPVTDELALKIIKETEPTPPFNPIVS